MLKENWRLISRLERVGDTLIVMFSFFLAYYSRPFLIKWAGTLGIDARFTGTELAPLKDYFIVLLVGLAAYAGSLHLLGAYSSMRLSTPWRLLRIGVVSSVFAFFSLAATLYLVKVDLSRSFIFIFTTYVALFFSAERYLVLKVLRFWRSKGRNYRNVMICGVGDQALRLAREIVRRPELGIRIRAFLDLREDGSDDSEQFRRRLREVGCHATGKIHRGAAAFARALKEYAIDEVIFTDFVAVLPSVEEQIIVASEQGVRTTIAADLFSFGMVKSGISYFGGLPLIHFQTPPGDRWELAVKRIVDVAVSAALLVILSPLLLTIALGVRIACGSPVIFRQTRVGLNGRLFTLFKFRSMVPNAEQMLPQLKEQNEMDGPVFKLKDDPRVTRFGRFLRRYSLDELPQLWNVLLGDMSLVGPRPPVPGEVHMYKRTNRRRLSMRPGITCTWQVSGRNEIKNFEEWVKLDLDYIDNWSLARDLVLLLKTVPAVLFGTGAR